MYRAVVLRSPALSETANHEFMKLSATGISASHGITSIEQLEAIYGEPAPRSLVKEIDHISDHYRAFIDKAPFVTVATCGPEGLDARDPVRFRFKRLRAIRSPTISRTALSDS